MYNYFKIGDHVIYIRDGVRGTVLGITEGACQVVWEDQFVSWENVEMLQKIE
ncbi:hypothetical protein [Brevibacillus dissolubilis]|uniref:hypothetical protein n=1 Tax=Brevibacillus dissolubilis TaxID=1844116 RepID=UPI00159B94C8|nr:hypothetical protein [Brevibacillus dissolubilis]